MRKSIMVLSNPLRYGNRTFYKSIFPSKKVILFSPNVDYETNDLIFSSGLVFGDIGSGKSCLVKCVAEKAVEKYGIKNVNAVAEPTGDLKKLMIYGLNEQLINILFADDITLRKIDKFVLRTYFRIRHLWKPAYNMENGYLLSMFGIHRFHSTPPELRTNLRFIIAMSIPSNPYDLNVIRGFITPKGVDFLRFLEKKKKDNPNYRRYSISAIEPLAIWRKRRYSVLCPLLAPSAILVGTETAALLN